MVEKKILLVIVPFVTIRFEAQNRFVINTFSDCTFSDGFCFVTIRSVTLTFCDTYVMCNKRFMTTRFVTISLCALTLCSCIFTWYTEMMDGRNQMKHGS